VGERGSEISDRGGRWSLACELEDTIKHVRDRVAFHLSGCAGVAFSSLGRSWEPCLPKTGVHPPATRMAKLKKSHISFSLALEKLGVVAEDNVPKFYCLFLEPTQCDTECAV